MWFIVKLCVGDFLLLLLDARKFDIEASVLFRIGVALCIVPPLPMSGNTSYHAMLYHC